MDIQIRPALETDQDAIHALHLSAFPESENQLVAALATDMLKETTTPATINLVAELDSEVVGHIAFSPVSINSDPDWIGYILAPLGVAPALHNKGIGTRLIESGIAQLSDLDVNLLFVYGSPKYYGRFGFDNNTATNFMPPYPLTYLFGWQAIVLNEGKTFEHPVELSCVTSLQDAALW